jgi:MFS family permease
MIVGSKENRILILVSLILAGESVFFLPFVLARIFRPTLLRVFDITNLELGLAFSVYGIIAMASYFFGGPLADRFPARKLMATALWATALGGIFMAVFPTGQYLIPLYGFWGFTTIFLFWAAMIRATREWGGDRSQGRAFGFLEGGRGLTAALIGSLGLVIFSSISGGEETAGITSGGSSPLQIVIFIISIIVFLSGLFVWLALPKQSSGSLKTRELPSIKRVWEIMKMPAVWMQGVIILAAYVGYKSTDDYSLYANQVLGFSELGAAGVGTAALWLRPVFAVLAGVLADRYRGTTIIVWCFVLMSSGSLVIYLGVLEGILPLTLILLSSTLAGVYGIRGIYFSLMKESAMPLAATGTAVGIMSVVGFTPDIFMSPLMGYLLDTYPGNLGHQYVFFVLFLFSAIGLIVGLTFRNYTYRLNALVKS